MNAPLDLRADHARAPLHLGRVPHLAWQPHTTQRAWHVRAERSCAALRAGGAGRWDSGPVESSACSDRIWGGAPLADDEQFWWTVRCRDGAGQWSPWAEPAMASCGLTDWSNSRWLGFSGGWPGKPLLLRVAFQLSASAASTASAQVVRAVLHIASPGGCTVSLNGTSVDDGVLDPGKTVFAKRVAYRVLDCPVTLFASGENVLGVVAGTGWFGTPMVCCVLVLWHADGTTSRVVSSGFQHSWNVGVGELQSCSPYDGEDVDLRLRQGGWNRPGFDQQTQTERTRRWFWAHVVDGPNGMLTPQANEPETATGDVPLHELSRLPNGQRVYDLGRNLAGWVRVRGTIPAGATLSLRFAEILAADGSLNQAPLYHARAEDRLIGDGSTVDWEPSFTYHGFRYVQADGPLDGLTFSGREVRNAIPRRSEFSCDHPLLEQLHTAMLRTEAANQHAVLTDCPQRAERMGWLNDLTARAPQVFICWDISRMVSKICDDYTDAQDERGAIPDTVPYRIGNSPADPVCLAPVLLPLLQHRHFGRTSEIVRLLPTMRSWVSCLLAGADADGVLQRSHWGDWSPPSGDAATIGTPNNASCPGPFISTAFLAEQCRLLARACTLAGETAEAHRWQTEHQRIAEAFRRFFINANGTVGTGSQSCLAVAIGLNLLSGPHREQAVAALAADVRSRGHLTTGNIATRLLLEVLSDHGHHDLAVLLATRTAYPSWGYMLEHGATTLWERWEGGAGGDMNSHSHPMNGSYQSWLYERLAGLMVAPDACAADRFVITPRPAAGVTTCRASLHTPRGRAAIAWQVVNGHFTGELVLPVDTTAQVTLPDGSMVALGAGTHQLVCDCP